MNPDVYTWLSVLALGRGFATSFDGYLLVIKVIPIM